MPSSLTLQVPLVGSPNATEDPKVASDITALQTWGASVNAMWSTGTLATRPGAGSVGRLYYATDTPGTFYVDSGAAWLPVAAGSAWTAITFAGIGIYDASQPPASANYNTCAASQRGDVVMLRGAPASASLTDIAAFTTLFTVPFHPLKTQTLPVGGVPTAPVYYRILTDGTVSLNVILTGGNSVPPSLTGLHYYLFT